MATKFTSQPFVAGMLKTGLRAAVSGLALAASV